MKHKITILLTILSISSFGQTFYEKQIIPYDALESDYFGQGIACSDSFIFISNLRYLNSVQSCVCL